MRDPEARALWKLHVDRQQARASRLTVRLPGPTLAEKDAFGLRGLLALVVFVAAVASWGDWWPRLERVLAPLAGTDLGAVAAAAGGLPSAERIARHLFAELVAALAGDRALTVAAVTVHEAPGCSAAYRPRLGRLSRPAADCRDFPTPGRSRRA